MQGCPSGNIHIPSQKGDEVQAKPGEIEESASLFELDQKVDIAVHSILTP